MTGTAMIPKTARTLALALSRVRRGAARRRRRRRHRAHVVRADGLQRRPAEPGDRRPADDHADATSAPAGQEHGRLQARRPARGLRDGRQGDARRAIRSPSPRSCPHLPRPAARRARRASACDCPRFGRAFTATKLSPVTAIKAGVAARPAVMPTAPPRRPRRRSPRAPGCDATASPTARTPTATTTPRDASRSRSKTDTCNADTDGDGMSDGWEYQSAIDLNVRALPYAGKKPYPNPLDPTDANVDYDGDGLTQADEYAPGHAIGTMSWPLGLNYSDGLMATGPRSPPPAIRPTRSCGSSTRTTTARSTTPSSPRSTSIATASSAPPSTPTTTSTRRLLSDDERDEDADMLSNYDETARRHDGRLVDGELRHGDSPSGHVSRHERDRRRHRRRRHVRRHGRPGLRRLLEPLEDLAAGRPRRPRVTRRRRTSTPV